MYDSGGPSWRDWRTWTIIAQIVTAVAAVTAIVLSVIALRQSDAASKKAVEEARRQAFEIAGSQLCIAYREQVWSMIKVGMSERQITDVFHLEPGNPDQPSDLNYRADNAYATGCGSIHDLVMFLPARQ